MENVQTKSSADLDLGRRPELTPAGGFVCAFSITKIFTILVEIYRRLLDAYWDFESEALVEAAVTSDSDWQCPPQVRKNWRLLINI